MIRLFSCGVNEYRGACELKFCVNDAIEFCKAFEENIMIDSENVYIASYDGNISNTEYCTKLKGFCEAALDEDTLVVFHSGHGGVDENEDSFLLMTNSFNESTYVYADQIINFLNTSKAKSKVVILDCCHSDVGERFIPPIDENVVVEKFYATGITILCACRKQEEATSENKSISVFTEFLCDALKDRKLVRGDSIFFNDLQNLVLIYVANYNRKHPSANQTPVMRTSMMGTATFPARYCQERKKRRNKFFYACDDFDLLDMEWDKKNGSQNVDRKFITARVVTKEVLDENNVEQIIEKIVSEVCKLRLPVLNWRQRLVERHPIEIVNLTIHNDYIDYEANIYKCHVVWILHNDTKWHRKNKKKGILDGYYSFQINLSYDYLKKMRIEDTFSDEELLHFWKEQIDIIIKKTGEFDRKYHAYKAGDMCVNEFCKYAKRIYLELNGIYNKCENSCFPIPFSEYKEFHEESLVLVSNARAMVHICAYHKNNSEEHLRNCVELELIQYYDSLKKWDELLEIYDQ